MKYLCAVLCFKNETPYLREWIEFHRLAGVEGFLLYDNASTDNPDGLLKPYVDAAVATVFHTDMDCCQKAVYYHALTEYRDRWRWMAFIDADEFLFCPDGRDLKEFLREYEDYPAVGAGWACFGSSGHVRKPAGLVIENYTRCAPRYHDFNKHIKSIVNPRQSLCPAFQPHSFVHYNCRLPAVDENRVPLQGACRDPNSAWTVDRIRLNHYITKSAEEAQIKRVKGRADALPDHPDFYRASVTFEQYDRNEEEDRAILHYLPELKSRLGSAS